jgi:hypothetical protein
MSNKKYKFETDFNRQETVVVNPADEVIAEEIVTEEIVIEEIPEEVIAEEVIAETIVVEITDEVVIEEIPVKIKDLKPIGIQQPIFINANFGDNIVEIGYTFLSTNEQHVVAASNGRLQLLQGRQYYIPVNKQIDSDNYNIKIHSDVADRFDVRFVKDFLAAIVPIRHNTILKNGEKLCVLYPL